MRTRTPIIIAAFILFIGIVSMVAVVSVRAAAGIMVAAVTAGIVFFKPFSGLILYLIMIYIMPQQIFPVLQKLRVMLSLAVLILAVFFIHKVMQRERIEVVSGRNNVLMVILLGLVFISHVVNLGVAPDWQGVWVVITVFLLFFIMVNLTADFSGFRKVCWTLVTCTLLLAANGLIMHFRGTDLAGNEPILGRIHWMSHFGDPNDYALAINTFIPFILVNLFEKDISRSRKLLLLVAAAIMLTAIYFTNSRGGYMALIVILAFFSYKKWGLLRGLLIGAAFIALAIVFAPSRMADVSPYERSASGRVNAWIAGLVMLKSRLLFGVGPSNFQAYHIRAAHSAFIQCMSELGLAGYFVWLALIYSSYSGLRKVESRCAPAFAKYARMIQLALVGFLASAVFLSQAYTPILYMIFALAALIIRLAEPPIHQPRGFTLKDYLMIGGIIGLSIIAYKVLAIVYI